MISPERKQFIENTTQQLLDKTGQLDVFPVSLTKIINDMGFVVKRFDPQVNAGFENISGMIDKEKKVIYINDADPSYRKRFTLAHEVGHFVLKHKAVKDYGTSNFSNNSEEIEADLFAANLLMPHKEFLKVYSYLNTSEIAAYFGVSRAAIGIRADQLFDNYV